MIVDIYSKDSHKKVKAFWRAMSKSSEETIDRCLEKAEGFLMRDEKGKIHALCLFGVENGNSFVYFFGARKKIRKSKTLYKFFKMLQRHFIGNDFCFYSTNTLHKKALHVKGGFFRWKE